ncbi:hypothetical protein RHMOL_Rhmol06G0201500 [Rhododendron molle]|uniref:Uncharacterized protein n=1 Tax=Rhododendron molle TaxID=49168 RepID=A0ACC0NGC6_RHOML|nr:hypothetical protein RHMOL_Rhmol06G0201500 [Rhododendron molle]
MRERVFLILPLLKKNRFGWISLDIFGPIWTIVSLNWRACIVNQLGIFLILHFLTIEYVASFCPSFRFPSTLLSPSLQPKLLPLSLSLDGIIIAITPVLLESEKIRDVEFERFREWKQQITMRGLHDSSPGFGFPREIRIAYELHLCRASPSENAVPVTVCKR